MMTEVRLIDANALLNDLKESVKDAREWKEETQDEEIKIRAEQSLGTFIECALRVKNASTIEAEPVRHGRWIVKGQDIYCSECNEESLYNPYGASKFSQFCPNCGADMREDDEDAGAD